MRGPYGAAVSNCHGMSEPVALRAGWEGVRRGGETSVLVVGVGRVSSVSVVEEMGWRAHNKNPR